MNRIRSPRWTAWAALGCLAAGSAPADDLPEIQKRGTLRVVVWRENLPELFGVDPSAAPGLEREILQGFADKHKLVLETVPVSTVEERITVLLNGRGDVAAGGLVVTEARRKLVDFTIDLFPIRHVAVTRKPGAVVGTLEQLRRERVGTLRGSSWAEEVASAGVPPASVETFPSPALMLDALREGGVSAVVMSTVWAVVSQKKDPELELGLMLGPSTNISYGVRKDEPQLRLALDTYIANVRRTPAWSRLVVKYFGDRGLEILKRARDN